MGSQLLLNRGSALIAVVHHVVRAIDLAGLRCADNAHGICAAGAPPIVESLLLLALLASLAEHIVVTALLSHSKVFMFSCFILAFQRHVFLVC